MERKFTDAEIVKAMECCSGIEGCFICPYTDVEDCAKKSAIDTIDLINPQKAENSNLTSDLTSLQNDLTSAKAEIERLREERERLFKECKKCGIKTQKTICKLQKQIVRAKTEAIKEFAERLLDKYDIWTESDATEYQYVAELTGNLVKEMTGEDNGN